MQKEKFKEELQKNGIEIRTQGQNEFTLCPFHPDKNPSLLINKYNTYCFACKQKFSFKDVLEKYGIKVYIETENPEIQKHIKLNKILEDYAQKSHRRLLELIESSKYAYIKNYLLKERKQSIKAIENTKDIGVLTKDTQTLEYLKQYKTEYPDTEENIDKLISILSNPDEDVLTFFYRNENFNISAIKFRNPRLQKRLQFRFWKKGKRAGLFGLSNINTRENKLFAVEGEFNLLSIKSALPETNSIAVGSSNLDVETLKAVVERFNFEIYYAYDNDEPGFKAVWQIKDHIPVYAFTTNFYNDLDEAYRKLGKNDFIQYLSKILRTTKFFNKYTKVWNGEYYNCESFIIEEDTLYHLKEDTKVKITTTPFVITEKIIRYGVEYLKLKTKEGEYSYPKDILLNSRKVINLTKEGFNFTSSECSLISKYVQQLLDENKYPVKEIKPQELQKNGYLKGDLILEKKDRIITSLISFREDGIWHIKYDDDFIERKISGYRITDLDVYQHLLTGKKVYEFTYENQFESYKDNFKSIDEFAKKIIIDKKQLPKLSLAISIALNKTKDTNVEKKLPDIRYGFYLSEGKIKYAGNWKADTQTIEYLPQAVENLKLFLSLFKDKRKSLAVLYSVINSSFAFIRKQLHIEAMIPILAGKGLTGKTTIVENLLKMFEVYREKSGQSINSYRRLAETVNENALPVLINECENVLRNQSLVDVLKNIGGQDFVAHSDAKKEITFISFSGLILTTNKIPQTLDTALISRFVPVIYEAGDEIIDKVKFEIDENYRNRILQQRRKLQELSDSFHIIGKALVKYATEYSDEVVNTLKKQAREANSYIQTGYEILLKFLSKFGIETSYFEPSYADTIETITSSEEEDLETRLITDMVKNIRGAKIDTQTKELFSIDVSVEQKIIELLEENDYDTLKKLLSVVLPEYFTISNRSSKVILRKSIINKLKLNISGGFKSICEQLGFSYASRYGERIGVMDFENFINILKQALSFEDDYDEELQKIFNSITFPIEIDGITFTSKNNFITYYKNLNEFGKAEIFEKLTTYK